MDDSLKFDLSFGGVNIDSVKEAWAKDEAKIQSAINQLSKLKLTISGVEVKGLDEALKSVQAKIKPIKIDLELTGNDKIDTQREKLKGLIERLNELELAYNKIKDTGGLYNDKGLPTESVKAISSEYNKLNIELQEQTKSIQVIVKEEQKRAVELSKSTAKAQAEEAKRVALREKTLAVINAENSSLDNINAKLKYYNQLKEGGNIGTSQRAYANQQIEMLDNAKRSLIEADKRKVKEAEIQQILELESNTLSNLNSQIKVYTDIMNKSVVNSKEFNTAKARLDEVSAIKESIAATASQAREAQRLQGILSLQENTIDNISQKLQAQSAIKARTVTGSDENTKAREEESRLSVLYKANTEEIDKQYRALEERNRIMSLTADSQKNLNDLISYYSKIESESSFGSSAKAEATAQLEKYNAIYKSNISDIATARAEEEKRVLTLKEEERILSLQENSLDNIDNKLRIIESRKNKSTIGSTDRDALTVETNRLNAIKAAAIETDKKRVKEAESLKILRAEENTISNIQKKLQVLNSQKGVSVFGSATFTKTQAEIDRLTISLNKMQGAGVTAFNATTKSASNMGFALNGIKQTLGAYASVLGAMRLVSNIREVTAEFELQRVALGAIIQDKAKADQLFSQITQLAVQSPFQVKELITYTKELSAYRIETDQLYDTTKRLADISAGLGVDMGRLILAYGQVSAASVLRGQELRQFTEAGIPLVSLLADKFSALRGEMVSTGEVFELISDRAVSFGMVKEIFNDMTNAGGTFYNMQKIQAETLAGSWSNLKDEIDLAMNAMGQENYGAIKGAIDLTKELWRNWDEVLDVLTMVALGYGAYKIATLSVAASQARTNILLKDSIGLKYKDILATVKQTIATEKLQTAASGMPTKRGVWRMAMGANTKEIIAAAGAIGGELTPAMARNAIQLGQTTAAQRKYMIQLGILTKEEVKNALAVRGRITLHNLLALSFGKVAAGARALGLALKSMLPLLAIGAIISAISSLWSGAEKLLGVNEEYADSIKAINDKQKEYLQNLTAIDKRFRDSVQSIKEFNAQVDKSGKKLNELGAKQSFQTALIELNKLKKGLDELGLGGVVDMSDVNIDNIVAKYDEVNKILQDASKWGVQLSTRMAEGFNAVEGWWGMFGDNLKTDMDEMNEALSNLFMKTDFSYVFESLKNELSSIYDELNEGQKSAADAFLMKREDYETEIEYNQRLMKAYSNLNTLLDVKSRFAGKFTSAQMQQFEDINAAIDSAKSAVSEYGSEIDKVVADVKTKLGKELKDFTTGEQASLLVSIKTFFADPEKGLNEYAQAVGAELVAGKLNLPMDIIATVKKADTGVSSELQRAIKESGLFANISEEELSGIHTKADAQKLLNDELSKNNSIIKASISINEEAFESMKGLERGRLQESINKSTEKGNKLAAELLPLQSQIEGMELKRLGLVGRVQSATSYRKKESRDELQAINAQISAVKSIIDAKDVQLKKEREIQAAAEAQQAATFLSLDKFKKESAAKVDAAKEENKALLLFADAIGVLASALAGGKTADPRIAALKTEIALVQEAYKKYQDLEKQIGSTKAQEKITKLYDNVFKEFKQLEGAAPAFSDKQLKDELGRALKIGDKYLSDSDKLKLNMDISDADLAAMSNKLKSELAKLQSKIDQQQKANKFFESLLGLTGDQKLATSLTVGIYGAGFEDTAAAIREQLTKAFEGVDISAELNGDAINYAGLTAKLDELEEKKGETARKVAQDILDNEKNSLMQYIQSLYSTLEEFQTFEERKRIIAIKGAEARKKIEANALLPEKEKVKAIKASEQREVRLISDVKVEEFKASDDWMRTFEDIENVATPSLERLIEKLRLFIETNKDLSPEQIKTLMGEMNKWTNELNARNPFAAILKGMQEYVLATEEVKNAQAMLIASQKSLTLAGEEAALAEEELFREGADSTSLSNAIAAQEKLKKAKDDNAAASSNLSKAEDKQKKASSKMAKGLESAATMINKVKDFMDELVEVLGVSEDSAAADVFKALGQSLGLIGGVVGLVSAGFAVYNAITALTIKQTAALMAVLTPLLVTMLALVSLFAIFSFISAAKVRRANKEIERQQELLDGLEYSYKRLGKAMEDALGTDAIENYNKQYSLLLAQSAAKEKQAAAERSKGKKEDKDKTKDYLNDARDLKDQASDMISDFSKNMMGFGLADFAKELTSIWIEARLSGESTMDALNKKWKEVMRDMVANTLMAKAIEATLQPIFDKIDTLIKNPSLINDPNWWKGLQSEFEGQLKLSDEVLEKIFQMLKTAGVNLSESADGMTGISKNVANASEDQLTGLAAGINTQNGYFAQTVTVATNIYAMMVKWDAESANGAAGLGTQELLGIQTSALAQLQAINANTLNTVGELVKVNEKLDSVIGAAGIAKTKSVTVTLR